MAAALRLLLLDGLVHTANRKHRLPLVFTVTDAVPDPGAINWYLNSVIHPGTGKTRLPSIGLGFDDFLRRVPIVVDGSPVTVKDLIRFFANKEGGVHFDQVVTGTDAVLREWRPMSTMRTPSAPDRSLMTDTLAGIARVTVDALTPLRTAVVASLTAASRARLGLV